eukprot:TRINITY_DN20770_c0_g1_i1.p1 TRINITY_DN20770_c0_g1~~TRINITY_DN20770_c0_g1_i1.p1  ORF type:complete len:385 (+),score=136.07 TRINITY_DN20770_c0_g1_i1:160-1314(+)
MAATPAAVQADIKAAQHNIRRFASVQRATMKDLTWEDPEQPGVTLGHKHVPIDRVGLYIPGGRYPIIAAACMQSVTAKAAGVNSVVACTPTRADVLDDEGNRQAHPYVVAALHLGGVSEIHCVGGIQAVGAMAHGTEHFKPVDFLCGPGNAFVAEAKLQLFGKVGIDLFAGPTETLVVCDDSADVELLACDLLGQAEHGVNSPAILLTSSKDVAYNLDAEVQRQLELLPTADAARPAWRDYGEVILVESDEELVAVADHIASEHTQIIHKNPKYFLDNMKNYGSLFVGVETNVSYGDKCIGTNHTLPTLKAAKYTGGLWVGKFIKTMTHQYCTKEASVKVGELCSRICNYEGMIGHGYQADIRVARWHDKPEEITLDNVKRWMN